MHRVPVQSSNLASVGYSPEEMILEVGFNNGSVYQYFEVPQAVHAGLMNAPSHGSYLAHAVKGVFSYQRIG